MNEQPRIELPPIPQEWVKSVRETPSSKAPTLKKPVSETPSSKAPTLRTEATKEFEKAPTLKTDETVQKEQEALAAKFPTVKTEATKELEAAKAQTFKTGQTVALEEAAIQAKQEAYEAGVAASKETMRKIGEDYMEYDALHNRISDWLKKVDYMLASPGALQELGPLKAQIEAAKAEVEKQMDVEQYGIAKSEPGAAAFKVEVPKDWFGIEARLNEIMESMKAGKTVREPMVKEEPTVRLDKAA